MQGDAVNKEVQCIVTEKFDTATINGVRVEVSPCGDVVVHTDGLVDTKPADYLKAGDVVPEGHRNAGLVYGGVSQTTGRGFYIAPEDSGVFTVSEAQMSATNEWRERVARDSRVYTSSLRAPSMEEFEQIRKIKDCDALKGTFNEQGRYILNEVYCGYFGVTTRLSDGVRGLIDPDEKGNLRCVYS